MFLYVNSSSFKDKNNKFYELITDNAVYFCALELSCRRVKFVEEINYWYDYNTGNNIFKKMNIKNYRAVQYDVEGKMSYRCIHDYFKDALAWIKDKQWLYIANQYLKIISIKPLLFVILPSFSSSSWASAVQIPPKAQGDLLFSLLLHDFWYWFAHFSPLLARLSPYNWILLSVRSLSSCQDCLDSYLSKQNTLLVREYCIFYPQIAQISDRLIEAWSVLEKAKSPICLRCAHIESRWISLVNQR